jgi:hypothetical protein
VDALYYQFNQGSLQLHLQSFPDDVVETRAASFLVVFNQEDDEPKQHHVLFLVMLEDVDDYPHTHIYKLQGNPCLEVSQVIGLVLFQD